MHIKILTVSKLIHMKPKQKNDWLSSWTENTDTCFIDSGWITPTAVSFHLYTAGTVKRFQWDAQKLKNNNNN